MGMEVNLKTEPYMLQIKVSSLKDLIKGCFKKEPAVVSKNMKDAHMNTIGPELLLLSANKNA